MSFFSLHHLIELLHAYGNVVLGVVVGLESVGLPLPGETLLIAAAVIAATSHQMSIALVILSAAVGAVVGQMTGYAIGWGIGFRLLRRYGRFIVLLRTLAALLAGANHMPWGRFMTANVVGSVVWSALYGGGAYLLGQEAKHLAGPVAIGIGVAVAGGLVAAGLWARRREHQLLAQPARADSAQ